MPSKGVKKTKQTEQKKIVTSTLLTISLKLDNHLNAREIISLQQAKDYIREISKLKIKSNDAKSRQVSEKLTSTLKGLINEYTNKVTGSESSNTFSLNNNFERKSNQGLNIITESEAFVVATNADHSQNKLIEPVNIEDKTDINNNISIPIDNMSKIFLKEENFNTNVLPCIMGKENIDNSNLKHTNNEPSANKNKTACTNDTEMIVDTECVNNMIIPKDNVNEPSGSKKRNSKKKRKNDLTWIENIKLIREIDTEEHLVSNLEESFWSDLTKPANCSLDFETD